MVPIAISSLAFVLMLLGIAAGGWVQGRLPEGHLSPDSKEVIKLSMGVMGTLAALVLGLLVANTQNSYSARESEIKQLTAHVILLDTLLNQYGNEAQNARALLRNAVSPVADRIWREAQSPELQSAPFKAASQGEAFFHEVQDLQPSSDNQREIKQRLLQITTDAAQARFLLFSHLGSSIPVPFLGVLVFWLVVLFAGFAVLARPNATTLGALIICALSVSGAIFLMLELDQPFSGTMAIQSESFRNALPPLRP
jgi:hypothetical protein